VGREDGEEGEGEGWEWTCRPCMHGLRMYACYEVFSVFMHVFCGFSAKSGLERPLSQIQSRLLDLGAAVATPAQVTSREGGRERGRDGGMEGGRDGGTEGRRNIARERTADSSEDQRRK